MVCNLKFTNGFWTVKDEYTPIYAVEYFDHKVLTENGRTVLEVYAPSRHFFGHAAAINLPVLTYRFTAPREGAIRGELIHFKGRVEKGPFYEVNTEKDCAKVEETDTHVIFRSGSLCAKISKKPDTWDLGYYHVNEDGTEVELTNSGWRNACCMQRNDGVNFMHEQLQLGVGEYVYGLGERFTPFVKNGQTVDMWNEDGGTATEIAYKNIPFYISNKGYGVFVDTPKDVSFELGSEKVERVSFSVEGDKVSYVVFDGPTPKKVLDRYTAYTGRPALPPEWSFGLWLSTSFTTSYDENTVTSFIEGMEQRNLPLSVFHYDCCWMKDFHWTDFVWDPDAFPNPKAMIDKWHKKGLKVCCWINSYISQMSRLFDEGVQNGYLVKKSDGSVWQTDMWQCGMALVDFTNPAACEWYKKRLGEILDMGVDAIKTDFGERIAVRDIVYYDGSDPVKMHNYYTQLYNKCVFELLEERKGKGQAVLFARSATAGGQQFPVHWGGDCTATFLSMAESLRAGLSLSLCGFGFWSHDIGGFENTATADVYKRWVAFGMLSSHSRLHGSTSYRVPWVYDDEACDVLRHFTNFKLRYMPYIWSKANEAHECGIPCMRAMMLEFPEDRLCDTLDRQYMLGDNMLVSPVLNEAGIAEYYLPAGKWTNLLTGEVREGGKFCSEKHDYFSLPLYARPNSVLISGTCDTKPDYDYTDGFCVELYEIEDGAEIVSKIYDDKGKVASNVTVKRAGNKITVTADGKVKNWSAKLGVKGEKVEAKKNSVEITL